MLRGHRALKGSKRGARNHMVHGPTRQVVSEPGGQFEDTTLEPFEEEKFSMENAATPS